MKVKLQSFPTHNVLECQPSLNIQMSISPNMLEAIVGPQLNDKILLELEEIFPPTNPQPTEDLSTVMYRSGQRSVVEWIRTRLKEDNGK